ncbi:MAG TPA: hypothetical protein VFP92_08495 [Rhodanobacteraceae bacterium]|nr:hypothetical protein [Rhodanobacteraceae bacterium]
MRKQLLMTGLCCGLAFAPAPATLAQTTDQTTDHQRIKALEARVAAIEKRLDMTPAAPQPEPHPQPAPTTTPTPVAAPPPTATPRQPAPVVKARPASSDWSQLQRGMNPREVTALIGPPELKQVRAMSEIWFYPDNRQIEFDNSSRLQSWSEP